MAFKVIDYKVICGFDISLSKTFHCLLFLLSESSDKLEQRLALVSVSSERGFGKDDLREGGGLESVFMVNNYLVLFVCLIALS